MKKLGSGLLFLALAAGLVLYAAGAFQGQRIAPGKAVGSPGSPAPLATALAERASVEVYEDAVATVESRLQVTVAAQVQARVAEVMAEAGSSVEASKPLLTLDARELSARRAQAGEALAQADAAVDLARQSKVRAEAVLGQATKRHERAKGLLSAKATSPEQAEEAESGFLQAQAGVAEAEASLAGALARVEQAKQVVAESEVALGYAAIAAPITGVVSVKAVEPGDLAWPGKTLFEIIDPEQLRVEAQVREGLIARIRRGGEYEVFVPSLGQVLIGTVAEVCPTADPQTRTFRVRVDVDPVPGLHPGMFGRLRIPLGPRETVRIPEAAVARTGQLTTVLVKDGERWERRAVTLGRDLREGRVEVLSGLEGGETLGLAEAGR